MVLHEFRVPVPLTVEEFSRGQLYMVAKLSLEATTGDEGIEWIKNEPYDNTDGHLGTSAITHTPVPRNKGQYTLKRYLLRSKVPSIVAHLVPTNALFLIEEAWNAYPHCKTVLVNGYLDKTKFKIDVETMHVDANCALDNALSLGPEELKHRKVEYVDVRAAAHGPPGSKDYKPQYDVGVFKSAKTGRGPLTKPEWWKEPGVSPLMCAYKLVRADFKYFGLQSTVEGTTLSSQRKLFAETHARAFVGQDEWIDITMADVRKLEEEVAAKSAASLAHTVKASASIHPH